jgi:hypothetical protein
MNLSTLPDTGSGGRFDALLSRPGLRIERIGSRGQASPADLTPAWGRGRLSTVSREQGVLRLAY